MTESHIRLYERLTMTDKISDSEKLLYGLIYRFKDQPDGCYMSNKTIGVTLAWDERKIRRILNSLRRKKLVKYISDGHTKKVWPIENPDMFIRVVPDEPGQIETPTRTKMSKNPDNIVQEPGQKCPPIKEDTIQIKETHTPPSAVDLLGQPLKPESTNGDIRKISHEIKDYWNSMDNLPSCRVLNDERRKSIAKLWKLKVFREQWRVAIQQLNESSFHTGTNDRGWKASFEWFTRSESNFVKAFELDIPEGQLDKYKVEVQHVES
jgi:hypothetical protein